MTVRDRIGIAIPIAVLVVVIAVTAGVHRPRWVKLMSLVQEVAHAERVLGEAIDHQGELDAAKMFLPQKTERQGVADQQFLTSVSAEIARLGLCLRELAPQDRERASESYYASTYKVELDGSYAAILEFLEYLERMPEIVEINSIDVRSNKVVASNGHRTLLTFKVTGY